MTTKTLGWTELRTLGTTDNGNRWYPRKGLDLEPYFNGYRSPSRAWPNSYAKAAQTQKFARWLRDNRPELAARVGIV